MANLTNKYIYETYPSLVGIGTSGTSGVSGTLQPLTDGKGVELPMKASTTEIEFTDDTTIENLYASNYGKVIDADGNWLGNVGGISGTSGTSGTSGATGSSGTSGVSGTSGTSGVNGSSGATGSSGTSGTSGVNGSSGATGSSGTSGVSGTDGTSGTDGASGSSGTSGVSGTSGAAGTSGTSGLNGLGLPAKVIAVDNTGWTESGSVYYKTITFGSAFADTNYSTDFIFNDGTIPSDANWAYSNSSSYFVGFQNKTTTSIEIKFAQDPTIFTTWDARLVLVAAGESNGSGTSGTAGTSGTSGSSGVDGISNSFFNYQATTNSQSGAPTNGHLKWNNVVQQNATEIIVSDIEQGNTNVDLFLGNLAVGSIITIQDKASHLNYQTWTITSRTDNATYWTYGVTLNTSTHSFSNNDQVLFIVVTTPSGTSGTSGSSGISGSSGTDGTSGTAGTSGTSGTTPSGTITTSGPNTITNVWSGTQAQYNALGTYSATTLYFID